MNEQELGLEIEDEYVDVLIERLMQQYLDDRALPETNGRELSPQMLYMLCRAIILEGYGT